jgi:hypothetical protein
MGPQNRDLMFSVELVATAQATRTMKGAIDETASE